MADMAPGLKDLMIAANRRLTGAAPPLTPGQVSALRDNLGRRAILRAPMAYAVPATRRSDGLRAPMNAPPAADLTPGVAAGASTPIVRANLVIISGPTGAVVGMFVYTPGTTPGLGNPPIAWMSSSNFDPFGNALPSTTGIAGTGTFRAGNTLINTAGDFIYSSTPAHGDLIATVTPVAGTDGFTNPYMQGITGYQLLGGTLYGININTGSGAEPGLIIHNLINPPTVDPGISGAATSGAPNKAHATLFSGQAVPADVAAFLQVISALESGFTNGQVNGQAGSFLLGVHNTLIIDDNGGACNLANTTNTPNIPALGGSLVASTNNTPVWIKAGKTNQVNNLISSPGSSASGNTNNTTSLNALTPSYPIDANDATSNTWYRLKCGGHGTQGSTQQALNLQFFIFGQIWGATTTAATDIPASANFHWEAELTLVVSSGGTAQNGVAWGRFSWSQSVSGASAHEQALDTQRSAVINTTIPNNGAFQAGWGAIVGAPTIVCIGSTWERGGP